MADSLSPSPESLLARLKPGETPIFRHTKLAILEMRKRTDSLSAKELARVILADPLATLRVIYQANNRSSRSLSGEIASVEHAVLMQGIGPFLNKAASLPVFEDKSISETTQASIYRLLRIAQHAAWQARDFAVQAVDTRAEEVEVAALLYYVPDLLFWLQAPDIARRLARERRRMSYAKAEESVLGLPLSQLRLDMMAAWQVPEVTRDLLNPDFCEQPRQALLCASLEIAHRGRHGWWQEKLPGFYEKLASLVNAPVHQVATNVHINAIKAARFGRWIPSPPAAAWLPMLPGDWPPEPDEAEEPSAADRPESAATAALPVPPPHQPPPAEEVGEACPLPNQQVLHEALRNIEAHLDSSLTLNQMSAHILRGLHTGLGLTRLIFAMITPDGKRIKTRFTLGIPTGDPLRHFEFDLGTKDLFAQLMAKPQGVWLKEDNRAKLWPMIDPKLQAMIGNASFFAMALFNGPRPIGLIYADRGHNGCGLDSHTYTDFKMFCLQAARGLGKLKP